MLEACIVYLREEIVDYDRKLHHVDDNVIDYNPNLSKDEIEEFKEVIEVLWQMLKLAEDFENKRSE